MATPARLTRQKISTTISSDTLSFLEDSIKRGEARTLAEAIDLAIRQLLVYQNLERLANDTTAHSPLGTDRFSRREKSQQPKRLGSDRSVEQQRPGGTNRHSIAARRDGVTGTLFREGTLHSSSGQGRVAHAREAHPLRHADEGSGFSHPPQL